MLSFQAWLLTNVVVIICAKLYICSKNMTNNTNETIELQELKVLVIQGLFPNFGSYGVENIASMTVQEMNTFVHSKEEQISVLQKKQTKLRNQIYDKKVKLKKFKTLLALYERLDNSIPNGLIIN